MLLCLQSVSQDSQFQAERNRHREMGKSDTGRHLKGKGVRWTVFTSRSKYIIDDLYIITFITKSIHIVRGHPSCKVKRGNLIGLDNK